MEALEKDQFEVVGPKGYIAPAFWPNLIQPGWEVSLCFTGDFGELNAPPRSEVRPRDEVPKEEELPPKDSPKEDLSKRKHKLRSNFTVSEMALIDANRLLQVASACYVRYI